MAFDQKYWYFIVHSMVHQGTMTRIWLSIIPRRFDHVVEDLITKIIKIENLKWKLLIEYIFTSIHG